MKKSAACRTRLGRHWRACLVVRLTHPPRNPQRPTQIPSPTAPPKLPDAGTHARFPTAEREKSPRPRLPSRRFLRYPGANEPHWLAYSTVTVTDGESANRFITKV